MKLIKFEPEVCRKNPEAFKGHVVLDMPSYPQRLMYVKSCQFAIKKGEDGTHQVSDDMSNIDSLVKMIDIAKAHVKEVHLKRKDGDTVVEYKSYEDLLDDAYCDEISNEIAGAVINGVKLGKS